MNKPMSLVCTGAAIALYVFILLVTYDLRTAFTAAFGVSIPLTVGLFYGLRSLDSQTPRRVFFTVPKTVLLVGILFSIILEGILFISYWNAGEAGLVILFWPFYALYYIASLLIISVGLAWYLYSQKFQKAKLFTKWAAITILLIPYLYLLMVIFDFHGFFVDRGRIILN